MTLVCARGWVTGGVHEYASLLHSGDVVVLCRFDSQSIPSCMYVLQVGRYLRAQLSRLQASAPFLGDVRGIGLMVGIEVVRMGSGEGAVVSKEPAPVLAKWIKERMKVRDAGRCSDRGLGRRVGEDAGGGRGVYCLRSQKLYG